MTSLEFYNVNNHFLRYRFGQTYLGDMSGASAGSNPEWGFLPLNNPGRFEPYNPDQTALSARVLSENGLPDILCLCEVESLQALRLFNDFFLGSHYPYALLIDSYDLRQIDVGILSTKEILAARSHVDDLDPMGRRLFSRDCLEVTIGLNPSGNRRLYLFINHLKSKFTRSGSRRPLTTRIFRGENDPEPMRINFDFPRFDLVEQTGQQASDHCPVFLALPV